MTTQSKSEWTPAVIATRKHVLQFHKEDPGNVTRFAGERIRVQEFPEAAECQFCDAPYLRVHPEYAKRLWGAGNATVCLNRVVMD